MNCPLCHSTDARLLETVTASDLARLYAGALGVDVTAEFAAASADAIRILRCNECAVEFSDPAVGGSAEFYGRVQGLAAYYQESKPEFEFASRQIAASDRVLEVGAGAGAFARRVRCESYTGLEFNPVSIARAAAAGIELRSEDLREHAARHAGQYSVACAFQVLEHVPAPGDFIADLARALVPGGRMILSVPSEDSFLGEQCNNPLNLPPHHLTWWRDSAFSSIARLHGLELLEVRHHELDALHVPSYLHTRLVRRIGGKVRRVDLSAPMRLRQRLARALLPVARRVASVDLELVPGESVTALFRKPAQ
jgi:SAM-dependent methyltransferase